MSNVTCTINNVSYPVHLPTGFNLASVLEARDVLVVTIIDSVGIPPFQRGTPITFSDTVTGQMYNGFVQSDAPMKLSPDPTRTIMLHTITCMDDEYNVDKRSNENPYAGGWHTGDIATDMVVNGNLAAEGIKIAAALRHETSTADFSTGTLNGTIASTAIVTNDGDLELAKAGSDVTITESATAQFSTGTLTNMVAANNSLSPTTQSALKSTAFLPLTGTGSFLSVKFWSGSMTVGTLDTLNYDLWIASSSPQFTIAIDLTFSDGTALSTTSGPADQNGISAKPATDLTNYAKDTWYTRNIALTSALNGKTITSVLIYFAGTNVGTYTAYVKNVYLTSQSGSPFFSTSATVTNVNPPAVFQYANYIPTSTTSSVVSVFNPTASLRTSPTYTISTVQLLRSSSVAWSASTPSGSAVVLKASYDGGVTYQTCTNNQPLPMLPAGSNISTFSLILQESFSVGTDPTSIPSLLSLTITLQSAPAATKSDIVTTYATQTQFNTGTYSNTSADSSGNVTLTTSSRNWNDGLITNQTSFFNGVTNSVVSQVYQINSTGSGQYGVSRLDFAGSTINGTIECDVKIDDSVFAGITYRQFYWANSPDETFGYCVTIYHDSISGGVLRFEHGTNGTSNPSGIIIDYSTTVTPGTFYHLKIVYSGPHHQVYFNNATSPQIDVIDTTYQQSGGIGLRMFNNGSGTAHGYFDNFTGGTCPSGTWLSPSVSLTSLGTSGLTGVSWKETNTSNATNAYVIVQSTLDGGSTYQTCTNQGTIPNLPAGTNLSGKSIQFLVSMGENGTGINPIFTGLVWKVLGAYPTVTGTRTTAPIGNDTLSRGNVTGNWGNASDEQAWNQSGTGTANYTSNQATIANTTGDMNEILGSHTLTDMQGTTHFTLSASTMTAFMYLRYQDANNYYRLNVTTTAVSIIKKFAGLTSTLATVSVSTPTNTLYWMRFVAAGGANSTPINLYGRVWADGVLEPTAWTVQAAQ